MSSGFITSIISYDNVTISEPQVGTLLDDQEVVIAQANLSQRAFDSRY